MTAAIVQECVTTIAADRSILTGEQVRTKLLHAVLVQVVIGVLGPVGAAGRP